MKSSHAPPTKNAKKRKLYRLHLTKLEVMHLRDLCSIMLATDLQKTVSQALANAEQRPIVEASLWNKVARACAEAKLPTGDIAPDFIVAAAAAPQCGVFRIAEDEHYNDPEEASEENDVVKQILALEEAKTSQNPKKKNS